MKDMTFISSICDSILEDYYSNSGFHYDEVPTPVKPKKDIPERHTRKTNISHYTIF